MSEQHALSGVMDFWEAVIDDMEATAEEYRESGWDVTELHPGDVTPLPAGKDSEAEGGYLDDRTGLDVLVPGDEFRTVEELAESLEFDAFDAYTAREGDVFFAVVVMQAADGETAVALPLYYRLDEATETLRRVRDGGEMRTFVRPLNDERRVVFTQADPDPFVPDDALGE
ncbi:MAG: hypothetical protein ABEJ79_02190 [Halolamina sp.]